MFAIKPNDLSFIPRTHIVDGENWFLEVILRLCMYCSMLMHTNKWRCKEYVNEDIRELGISNSVGRVPSTHEAMDSVSSTYKHKVV